MYMDKLIMIEAIMRGLVVVNLAVFVGVYFVKPFLSRRKRWFWDTVAVAVMLLELWIPIWAMAEGLESSWQRTVEVLLLVFSGVLMASGTVILLNRNFFEVIFNNFHVMKITEISIYGVWGEICVKKSCYSVRLVKSQSMQREHCVGEILNVRVVNMLRHDEFEVVPI